jgi:uncharacterized protein (DUF934 family)
LISGRGVTAASFLRNSTGYTGDTFAIEGGYVIH